MLNFDPSAWCCDVTGVPESIEFATYYLLVDLVRWLLGRIALPIANR
jgi:hypothetical protein